MSRQGEMAATLVFCLQLAVITATVLGDPEVCYENLGCFSNTGPFSNTESRLPISPEVMGVKHHLYTSSDHDSPQILKYDEKDSVKNLKYVDPTRPLKIIVHGFKSGIDAEFMGQFKNAILQVDPDVNIYLVGWSRGAQFPWYFQSVANARVVAAEIKVIIDQFVSEGLSLDDVHLIGHSIGAHICGAVGFLTEGKIGRITGMEPAAPGFDGYSDEVRLDKTDAQYVDVIHTDSVSSGSHDSMYKKVACGGLGTYIPSGDLDIYVNGGSNQPGCGNFFEAACLISRHVRSLIDISCSHKMVTDLFLESLISDCPFTVYKCDSYADFLRGACLTCPPDGCNVLGYRSSKSKQLGVSFVNTFSQSPFCGYSYGVSLIPKSDSYGSVNVALSGCQTTGLLPLKTGSIRNDRPLQGLLFSPVDVGLITAVTLQYDRQRRWFWASRNPASLELKSFTVVNGAHNQTIIHRSFRSFVLKRKQRRTTPLFFFRRCTEYFARRLPGGLARLTIT